MDAQYRSAAYLCLTYYQNDKEQQTDDRLLAVLEGLGEALNAGWNQSAEVT